ncbi:hypothetical protein STCU_12005 [Strigomonas culicis]|uniref:Uncharacterized protein n=1 Tax=Strigomonas culicis TaxID=28005 RepID=S9UL93_9TRYP|nr:hypothetical protein STCU_12005 [Strigomonas culicis]|eukprot:EPY15466.1 hypothetical protein STCU_12005 [Strigomonas culicis]
MCSLRRRGSTTDSSAPGTAGGELWAEAVAEEPRRSVALSKLILLKVGAETLNADVFFLLLFLSLYLFLDMLYIYICAMRK